MRITYIDGIIESIEADSIEIGETFVTFQDKDDEEIAEVNIEQIRKIEY